MSNKVLILENNINYLSGLEAKLKSVGFEALTFDNLSSINELLEFIIVNKINYILADSEIPNFKSHDIVEAIRRENYLNEILFFIYSGENNAAGKNKLLNSGADYYFDKNELNLDQLIYKICKIIENKKKLNFS